MAGELAEFVHVPELPGRGPGALVRPGDPVALAAALAAKLDDPPDPETCRAAAAGHALERQARRVAGILARAAGGEGTASLHRR